MPWLDPSVCTVMTSRRPLPLLVNLQHLMFDGSEICLPFFGPKLSRLSTFDFNDTSPVNFIPFIKTLVPNLEHLSISGFAKSARTICEVVCSLHHLHSLYMFDIPVTSACITHLSTLPNLRQLSATITADSHVQTGSCNRFPALVGLELSANSWPLLIDFLKAYVQDLPLRDFSCRVDQVPTPEHLDQLFDTLRKYLPNSVRGIVLSPPLHWNYPPALPVLNPNSIRRLLTFPNLENLAILTPISFEDVDDTLIGEIASAWPRLTSLEFPSPSLFTPRTKVTVCGLRPLADQCANLGKLSISLDPAVPDTHVRLKPDGTSYDTSLSSFMVGYSPMKDPVAVASFLADVFPNLHKVDAWDNRKRSYREIVEGSDAYLWDKVITLYRALVAGRRQERLHGSQSMESQTPKLDFDDAGDCLCCA